MVGTTAQVQLLVFLKVVIVKAPMPCSYNWGRSVYMCVLFKKHIKPQLFLEDSAEYLHCMSLPPPFLQNGTVFTNQVYWD